MYRMCFLLKNDAVSGRVDAKAQILGVSQLLHAL